MRIADPLLWVPLSPVTEEPAIVHKVSAQVLRPVCIGCGSFWLSTSKIMMFLPTQTCTPGLPYQEALVDTVPCEAVENRKDANGKELGGLRRARWSGKSSVD